MPGHKPSLVSTSLWQTPQAWAFTCTSPGPGIGISRSTISQGPRAVATLSTFIFFAAAIEPPQNEFRIDFVDHIWRDSDAPGVWMLGQHTKVREIRATTGAESSDLLIAPPIATQRVMLRLEIVLPCCCASFVVVAVHQELLAIQESCSARKRGGNLLGCGDASGLACG